MRNRKLIASIAMSGALIGGVVIGATLGNPLASGAEGGSKTTTTTSAKGADPAPKGPGHRGGRGGRGGFDLEVAAKALKLTTDELRTQLRAGTSLADIAKAQKVDKQDLIDALVKAGEARLDDAKKSLPDMIAKMVDAKPPTGDKDGHPDMPGGPGMPGGPDGHRGGFGLDAAAKALGMTADDLRTALADGKTLAAVAKDKGVDKQKVIDALVAQAKTHLDEAVKAGKLKQTEADTHLAEMTKAITAWVNDGKPAGMGPMGDHHGGGGMGDHGPGMPGMPGGPEGN